MDPAKAYGTFSFSHCLHGRDGWAGGRVDCLTTGGRTAVMTGVVTDSDTLFQGHRVGITVTDDGAYDRLGHTWKSHTGESPDTETLTVPRCLGGAPFEFVKKGSSDFRVLPWHPVYPAKQPPGSGGRAGGEAAQEG
ncbi:hypothetical protein [Streptomyces sp. NPDC056160]|uniref:hypothetical protein n=1 Tax=Streptomyces sp. NPDC056160 TaxID=3345731 RepID=UPI0035DB3BB1